MNRTLRALLSALFPALIFILLMAVSPCAHAQTGGLGGTVTDAASNSPLPGATVRVTRTDGRTSQSGGIADASGRYSIKGLAPGTYTVIISYISYSSFTDSSVAITASETTTLNAALQQASLKFDQVVVSASRRPEKITQAPASVSVVDARSVEEQPALTPVEHLKGIPGVDLVQSGLTQSTVVTRGFNNAFSGTLMTLTDNRIASVPSLRFNAHNFLPLVNEDIQQIEIIRGPGAALYGPNTANGVLHMITRSPFSSEGTWLSVAGGERSVFQGMFRHAGTLGGNLGYKVSGQYMRGDDWGYRDTTEINNRRRFLENPANAGVNPDTLRLGMRDSATERVGAELRLDYIATEDLTAIVAFGLNQAITNTEMTGVGAAQAQDWRYMYGQARILYKDLFFQAYMNQSNSGESYLLRTGEPVIDKSTLFVTQLQHSWQATEIEQLTYGADFILTNPVTDSTITGRNEGEDDITEFGVYVQSETDLVANLLVLVIAGRVDLHSRLDDPIFSPRAALVYTPLENQTVRLTYNRAYSAPSTNEMFLDIVAERTTLFDVRASGVPESGFSFHYGDNGAPQMRSFLGADPTAYIPATDVHLLWPGVQQVLKANIPDPEIQQLIDQIPAPPAGVVLPEYRALNATTGLFDAFDIEKLAGRSPVQPTINSTIELGYKGIIAEQFAVSLDLYRSQYDNFVGPLEVITPTVFLNQQTLQAYLTQVFTAGGLPADSAAMQAALYSAIVSGTAGTDNIGVPIGTVSPQEATDPTAVMLTYRNYGQITLYGLDLGLQVGLLDALSLNGSVSYVDKNFFENLDGVADLSLNAPKLKYSIGATYRDVEQGLNADLLLRHVDGFPVRSGVYIGDVPGYSTVDMTIGYRIPSIDGLNFTLTAQNLLTFVEGKDGDVFDLRHQEFVGASPIGRLVLGRLTYSFR